MTNPRGEAAFRGKLVLVVLQDRDHPEIRDGRTLWAVQRPVSYVTPAGDMITAPTGMVTDLASIPRFVSGLLPPDGPWVQAAIFHDLLYATQGTGLYRGAEGKWKAPTPCISRPTPYSRGEADGVLRDAMADLGISDWRAALIYAGVRVGGAKGWGS